MSRSEFFSKTRRLFDPPTGFTDERHCAVESCTLNPSTTSADIISLFNDNEYLFRLRGIISVTNRTRDFISAGMTGRSCI